MKPHPKLMADQQAVVARDFGMKKNSLHEKVKLAFLYYFLTKHGLGFSAGASNPPMRILFCLPYFSGREIPADSNC